MNLSSTLLIASHNPGKVAEFRHLLWPKQIEVKSAADLNLPEPEETGATFAENALLKATAASLASQLPALADDSGLVIPALGGAPGIYSARWAGPGKDFAPAFTRIEAELCAKGVEPTGTPAYFQCTLALALPGDESRCFEGQCHGTMLFPASGKSGFGYDPIFVPANYDKSFAELPESTKNQISHRAKALALFLAFYTAQQG